MTIGEEDYSNNPAALARFKPGYFPGAGIESGDDENDELSAFYHGVKITTNLGGTAIRFSLNDSLDSPVASGNLTIINGIIIDGVQYAHYIGKDATEEEIAKYANEYHLIGGGERITIKPNTLVTVTEYAPGLGTCTSMWRVVSSVSYKDKTGIPYCDMQLEGIGQKALDARFDPAKMGVESDYVMFVEKTYFDSMKRIFAEYCSWDGYIDEEEYDVSSIPSDFEPLFSRYKKARYVFNSAQEYAAPFISQMGQDVTVPGGAAPLYRAIMKGESCYSIIEDLLGFNGYLCRFDLMGIFQYLRIG